MEYCPKAIDVKEMHNNCSKNKTFSVPKEIYFPKEISSVNL